MNFLLKLFLALQLGLYRLSKGEIGGRMGGFKVLLLTTTGRKSGKTHTTPLGWFAWKDGYVIAASNGGASKHPAWYLNLRSQPQVTVQINEKVIPVTAEILAGEQRAQAWQQVITTAHNYAAYPTRTTREIPVILLHPGQA
jgi:deazaflavin-dependent oxidoreductase (nitroreductase family)